MPEEFTLTREELVEHVRLLTIPVDVDRLVSEGVLQKVRGGYKILDSSRLPKYAEMQIKSISTGDVVTFVKSNKAAQKLLYKLTGSPPGG